ncbi:MAG: glutathione S-transferase N-terminal domain-containing protein [Alphaproteobacteria bacterium]|nr:glutathione S-transferase N-terminal domain-containing protein [Alphaproteobacteria bacterium]
MIDFYSWATPNGRKISIALEEMGLAYRLHKVDITKGEQFTPGFLALNPNNKIPVIQDQDGPDGQPITVFESGAILIYLAEKTGQFLPQDRRGRTLTLQWLMFQMGGLGPMLGQTHHFLHFAPEKVPYGIERYKGETKRLYGVLNRRLGEAAFMAGDYSIADMAAYPWIAVHPRQEIDIGDFPNVARWLAELSARPAVQRGMAVG